MILNEFLTANSFGFILRISLLIIFNTEKRFSKKEYNFLSFSTHTKLFDLSKIFSVNAPKPGPISRMVS